jgi:hypothetical protein
MIKGGGYLGARTRRKRNYCGSGGLYAVAPGPMHCIPCFYGCRCMSDGVFVQFVCFNFFGCGAWPGCGAWLGCWGCLCPLFSLLLRYTFFSWRFWFHEALSASHTLTDNFMHTDKRVFLNKLSSVSILLSALLQSA